MPRIVACIKTYEVIEDRAVKISNHLSDELIEAVFYSFIKHREQALKELPAEEGAPIEGPQSVKEMITHIKAELQDFAHKVGASLVAGMAESLAKNMPLYRMARVTEEGAKRGIADSFYAIMPSKISDKIPKYIKMTTQIFLLEIGQSIIKTIKRENSKRLNSSMLGIYVALFFIIINFHLLNIISNLPSN
jgi:hypothetical protein